MKERSVGWLLSMLENVGVPSLYPWVFRNVRRLFNEGNERYLRFLKAQSRADDWLPKFFAGHELHTVYPLDPNGVKETLKSLSADEKEIVREGAARSWSHLLARDFSTIFNTIKELKRSDQYESRYTAALAPVRYYDDHATEEEKETIRSFWKQFEDDPRKGLWNLVRQQILDERS